MFRIIIISITAIIFSIPALFGQAYFPVRGRIIDASTRNPVPYAVVSIDGQSDKAAVADSLGQFNIANVLPGIYRLETSSVGYITELSVQYQISESTSFVELEMSRDSYELDNVVVKRSPFPRVSESPVSLRRIGLQEIEKSPGANRDVSRIVQAYPGVSFSPAGYRNDLIVRGGSPSENRFYLDGIEIPNINHFSTQGASGGPVGIVNADLIREIDFYTGAFPVDKSDALSSMLDVRLKDGNLDKQSFKVTAGASEAGVSGSGHIGDKTTYVASVRQSYLQMLFKLIGLPFLPNYIDAQFKVKHRFSKSDELVILGVAGFDTMTLNEDTSTQTGEYILGYLPEIEQETFTVGAAYRHYSDNRVNSVILSHSYLNNRYLKYLNNDDSSSDNLTMKIGSVEHKSTLKSDNQLYLDNWKLRYGAELTYSPFSVDSYLYGSTYDSDIDLFGWGTFFSGSYTSDNSRFASSIGMRLDGNNFSSRTAQLWRQISPRGSASYRLNGGFSLNASAGIYYQMPDATALSYKDDSGYAANSELEFMSVTSAAAGLDWRYEDRLFVSVEGFYKYYNNGLLSVENNIPLASTGADYGIIGNELLVQTVTGRSYGGEFMVRWQIPGRVSFVSSLTLFRSEYRNNAASDFIASSWDNRFISTTSGTYFFNKGWSVGAKICAIGGVPYTPYDEENSLYVETWNANGSPLYDYTKYNSCRLSSYAQIDLRVDKMFYFDKWMLGLYLDIQNLTCSKYVQPNIPMSTGEISNPDAPLSEQKYVMKYIYNISDVMLPTIGVTIGF